MHSFHNLTNWSILGTLTCKVVFKQRVLYNDYIEYSFVDSLIMWKKKATNKTQTQT